MSKQRWRPAICLSAVAVAFLIGAGWLWSDSSPHLLLLVPPGIRTNLPSVAVVFEPQAAIRRDDRRLCRIRAVLTNSRAQAVEWNPSSRIYAVKRTSAAEQLPPDNALGWVFVHEPGYLAGSYFILGPHSSQEIVIDLPLDAVQWSMSLEAESIPWSRRFVAPTGSRRTLDDWVARMLKALARILPTARSHRVRVATESININTDINSGATANETVHFQMKPE